MTYATCAGLLPPSAEPQRVALMIGLPVEVLANHELALRIRRELRSWLRATHTFSVDHTELTVGRGGIADHGAARRGLFRLGLR